MSEDEAILIGAIRNAESLPSAVRERAESVRSCERCTFDASYLDLLREQIDIAARGPEWTEILTRRLAALSCYPGLPTLRGTISTETGVHLIRVDPEIRQVIHHEFHESTSDEKF
ncbi:MAG: hypothetical protein EOP83_04760 [Verrucomicrobiaceae bacterium]|nr:MAG: hypothetical protein EOP83_04760 [Verrucomicrobiaceae bacterium]